MLKIKVEQLDSGDFRVSTSKDGGGWWAVGVTFPLWVLARSVAVAIARAWNPSGDSRLVVEIIDETAGRFLPV